MKLSVIIPVLNSHEVLRRHFLHWEKYGIPDSTEIIIVDDGSDPPLEYKGFLPIKIIQTHDHRPWTWAPARNRGVKEAKGEYVLMTDIDHILTLEALQICRNFEGDKVYFVRRFGILDENGDLSQDRDVLEKYGLAKDMPLRIGALPNNICLRRDVFWQIGGYREDLIGRPYPQGEDRSFKSAWRKHERSLGREPNNSPAPIYMFPNGYKCGDKSVDFNPFNLFHNLSRKSKRNVRHTRKAQCQT